MRCVVSYKSPDGKEFDLQVNELVTVGRDPTKAKIVLSPMEDSISGIAVQITVRRNSVVIANTSSYAQIDVLHEQGTRFLFPNEELSTTSSVVVVVPGAIYRHQIQVNLSGLDAPAKDTALTTPLNQESFTVPDERRPALVALCASRFYPDRYGAALLSATEIAKLLSTSEVRTSAKAVNNKLQRLRNDIAARLGIYLDTRDDLADWAIRNGHVTRSDVDQLGAVDVFD